MKKEQSLIPSDAHSFEVFAIKDCEESPTGKQAFIGFKITNGVVYLSKLKILMQSVLMIFTKSGFGIIYLQNRLLKEN